jgi:REP element-mobilizing transposase RayT
MDKLDRTVTENCAPSKPDFRVPCPRLCVGVSSNVKQIRTPTQSRGRGTRKLSMSRPRRHRKRIYHIDGDACARSLTFSCFQRRPFLSRDNARNWFIKALISAREKHPIDLWAYVIMPEHVHVIVWPRSPALKISDLLSSVKQSVARRARNYLFEEQSATHRTKQRPFSLLARRSGIRSKYRKRGRRVAVHRLHSPEPRSARPLPPS